MGHEKVSGVVDKEFVDPSCGTSQRESLKICGIALLLYLSHNSSAIWWHLSLPPSYTCKSGSAQEIFADVGESDRHQGSGLPCLWDLECSRFQQEKHVE